MSAVEIARERGVHHAVEEARWLAVAGRDAARYLQAMCTQDLSRLASGASAYAALADDRGRYLADFHVLRAGDRWILDAPASRAAALAERLSLFAVSDDVEVRDLAEERGLWHAEGPELERFGAGLPGIGESGVAGETRWEGTPILWARRSRYGESGCTWAVPGAASAAFGRELVRRGEPGGWATAEREDREVLRIEAGRPLGGVDVGEEDLLQEAGLTAAISLDKGCFPGQETLRRVARRGRLRRRLGGLRFAAAIEARGLAGASVLDGEGRPAGRVTSAADSPRHGGVALAWLGETIEGVDRPLTVIAGERRLEARSDELPFVLGGAGRLPETPCSPLAAGEGR